MRSAAIANVSNLAEGTSRITQKVNRILVQFRTAIQIELLNDLMISNDLLFISEEIFLKEDV